MLAVILAAGDGTRMVPLTHHRPKPLVSVAGQPLIHHILRALAQTGVVQIVIVDGYRGEHIRRALGDGSAFGVHLRYVRSRHVGRGSALSLYAAREAVGDRPFLLMMGDHLVSPALVRRILRPIPRRNTLCVDRHARWVRPEEATLVWVKPDGRIAHIGKGLPRYNGVDTGLFWFTPFIFRAVEAVRSSASRPPTLTETMRWLIERGPGLWAREVSGAAWMDVDTVQDLRQAERWLLRHGRPTTRPRRTNRWTQ
ncbi:MAG TPA: NDP-sugar synthase [Anaerolineales bacterium]|nr:NDP-sugar synthase [Anaerolineales bacterium]